MCYKHTSTLFQNKIVKHKFKKGKDVMVKRNKSFTGNTIQEIFLIFTKI